MSKNVYVSESDILGPIDNFGDNESLVSFERAMFEDYSFRTKIFLLIMSIHLGLVSWDKFEMMWYIYIICKQFCHWKAF